MAQKRGQGATEYLIVLAVVVIIGLIAIGVLRNVPTSGSAAKVRTSQAYWESAEIGITDYAIDGSGIVLFVRNNLASNINIKNIKLDDTNIYTTDTEFKPGEIKKITSTSLTCTAGSTYSYGLTFNYIDLTTKEEFDFVGSAELAGTCAK